MKQKKMTFKEWALNELERLEKTCTDEDSMLDSKPRHEHQKSRAEYIG